MASFSFSRQLGPTFVWSVGFQGVYGFGQFGETDKNFPTPVADTRPGIPAGFFYMPGRPNSAFGAIRTNNSDPLHPPKSGCHITCSSKGATPGRKLRPMAKTSTAFLSRPIRLRAWGWTGHWRRTISAISGTSTW